MGNFSPTELHNLSTELIANVKRFTDHLSELEKKISDAYQLLDRIAALENNADRQHNFFLTAVHAIRKHFSEEIKSVKPELEEKIYALRTDFEGFFTELEFIKKALAHDQKRFEDIYSLIQTIQGSQYENLHR